MLDTDALHLSGNLTESFRGVLVEQASNWYSRDLLDLLHVDDRAHFVSGITACLKDLGAASMIAHNVAARMRDPVCGWRWVEIHGQVVERDIDRRAVRMVGTISDINDRRYAEQKLSRLTDLYAALGQTSKAIVRMADPELLFPEICRIAVEHGHFHLAWIGLVNPSTGFVKAAAAFGNGQKGVYEAVVSVDANRPEGCGCIGTAIRSNHYTVCHDIFATPTMYPWYAAARSDGFQSFASFPFRRDGAPIGTLNLYATETGFFDEALIALLEGMANDISFAIDNHQREQAREKVKVALARSEHLKSAILASALDCIVTIDHRGIILDFNPAAETTFGYASADVVGRVMSEVIIPPDMRSHHDRGIAAYVRTGTSTVLNRRNELTAMHADGHTFPVELTVIPIDTGEHPVFTAFLRDISERRSNEELQAGQNQILSMVANDIALAEIIEELISFVEAQAKPATCTISLADAGGAPVHTGAADAWPILGKHRKVLGIMTLHCLQPRASGERDRQLIDIATNLAGIAIESRESDERIRFLAQYDGLTSLPNRFLFKEFLEHAIHSSRRNQKRFAVFFVDLDRFKNINDTFGHDAGDRVLEEIAKRLSATLRESDTVARMGGDEFYVLIEDLPDEVYPAEVARKLLLEASRPFFVNHQECQLTASIGIVMSPDDGVDAQTLLKKADIAMYRAKQLGKNAFQFYVDSKDTHSVEKIGFEARLRRAVARNEFVLHYQPKVDLQTGAITGVEALVRWQQPERGLLAPIHFIEIAEETGLIVPLGRHILEMAFRDSLILQARFAQPLRIAVNLSARQLGEVHFLDDLKRMLAAPRPQPMLLDLEITESMVMPDPEKAVRIMGELQAMGIRIVIDDFGTGYSSLAYLKRFPVHSLKIDRSFVQDIPDDPNDTAITQAVIAMGRSLGLRIIAEGVETERQMQALRAFGCDEFQGYYFSRPIDLDALCLKLQEHFQNGSH
ncbi:MAG: EAL domain-containing protein [Herminiimonas sp.]|nr:EAL domain-containing protein [Herminiimonas sp.]